MADKSECLTVGDVKWTRPVLESAAARVMNAGQWVVDVVLTEKAINQFNEIAGECYARAPSCPTGRVAIVLNDTVMSAPMVQTESFQRDQIERPLRRPWIWPWTSDVSFLRLSRVKLDPEP